MSNDGQGVPRIVVGVDGSAASARVLHWALDQAEAIGAVVEAVTAWDIPAGYGFGPAIVDGEDLAGASRQALAATTDDACATRPGVVVHQRVLRGHPAEVLLDQAKSADLLVIGSHGHGGFIGALLGSVSQHCVQHATCPVVVVPTRT